MRFPVLAMLPLAALAALNFSPAMADHHEGKHDHGHECALDFRVQNIDGETEDLEDYEGKVVLIVNVASRCGYTPQYEGLQAIYDKYKEKGFVVLGFPCNQFGAQESGSDADIKEFCSTKFDVTFPMFSKVEVNGDDATDLYKYLTKKGAEPVGDGAVSWNFEKFLIDREGNLVGRYKSGVKPESEELTAAIEKLL